MERVTTGSVSRAPYASDVLDWLIQTIFLQIVGDNGQYIKPQHMKYSDCGPGFHLKRSGYEPFSET